MLRELITNIVQPNNNKLLTVEITFNKETPDFLIDELTKIGNKLEVAYLRGWAACESHYGMSSSSEQINDLLKRKKDESRGDKDNPSESQQINSTNNIDKNFPTETKGEFPLQ